MGHGLRDAVSIILILFIFLDLEAREELATVWQQYCQDFADGQCDVAGKTDHVLRQFLKAALPEDMK